MCIVFVILQFSVDFRKFDIRGSWWYDFHCIIHNLEEITTFSIGGNSVVFVAADTSDMVLQYVLVYSHSFGNLDNEVPVC